VIRYITGILRAPRLASDQCPEPRSLASSRRATARLPLEAEVAATLLAAYLAIANAHHAKPAAPTRVRAHVRR